MKLLKPLNIAYTLTNVEYVLKNYKVIVEFHQSLFYFKYMKNAVLFVTHKIDDSIITNYSKLVNELDSNVYDVILCTPDNINTDSYNNVYKYDNSNVVRSGFVNPSYILETFYIEHNNYDYYYIIEYDVRYIGNYNDLFLNFDTNDSDLLAAYININKGKGYWSWWFKQYELSLKILGTDVLLKSCLSFARLSNKMLDIICSYPIERNDIIYEIYWPTIAYKHGLKINTLDSCESDDEFNIGLDLCNSKWYYYTVYITEKNKQDYIKPNRILTKYMVK